ncbi:hypothetical protein [Bacillus sp. 1P02SD]
MSFIVLRVRGIPVMLFASLAFPNLLQLRVSLRRSLGHYYLIFAVIKMTI